MIFGDEIDFWANQYIIFNGNSTHVQEGTGMVNKNIFTNLDKPSKIGVEWYKYRSAFIYFRTNDFTHRSLYLVNISRMYLAEWTINGPVNNLLHFWILRII